MRRYILSIIFLLQITLHMEASAQHQMLRHYGVEDGLTSNHVYAMLQDHKNYMWFSTDNGVSRFDGIEFKNFTSIDGLPDNEIIEIAEDTVGRIWLSCYNGIPCFIYDNKVNTPANNALLKDIVPSGYLRFCYVGKKLLLTTDRGSSGGFEIDELGQFKPLRLNGLFWGFEKNILSVSSVYSGQLALYGSGYQQVDSYRFINGSSRVPVRSLIAGGSTCGNNQFAVFYKNNKCNRYEVVQDKIRLVDSFYTSFPISRIYDFGGQLLAQRDNYGIVPVDRQFRVDKSRDMLFSGKLIQHFLQDREGNYWGCTAGEGVYMIPGKKVLVYDEKSGLLRNNIQKLASFKDEIYIGYNNSSIQVLKDHTIANVQNSMQESVQGKMKCLYADDRYVLSGAVNQIMIISKKTGLARESVISSVKCIRQSRYGGLWLGTHSGCYKLVLPDKITDTIKCGRTTAICERKNGDMIIGTLHGLLVCKKDTNKQWRIDTLRSSVSLSDISISCIEEWGDVLAIGTVQKGVLLLKGNDHEFIHNGSELQDINCKAMSIDKHGSIWVASFSGLHRIIVGNDIHHYTIDDIGKFAGLKNVDINDLLLKNDTAYIANSEGLIAFPINNIVFGAGNGPAVYINDMLVNDTSLHYSYNGAITLKPNANNIEFHFSGIDFKSCGNILFKYRLAGLRENWQYTTQNNIRYEALPPGDYRLEVAAMSDQKTWSKHLATIAFSISPWWWESKLFLFLLLLGGFVITYLVIRWSLLKKHTAFIKEASIKKHIAEIELKAIKAQINPHFIFNTLNAIQYFVSNGQVDKAENYLGKLGSLLRKTLDFSNKTVVTLDDEIKYLNNYLLLEKLRFDDSFIFTINDDSVNNGNAVQIPPMVLQPHIENALRHGFKGKQDQEKKIAIGFRLVDDTLICDIEDNGIGRKASLAEKQNFDLGYISKGIELSHSKLDMYEQLTGKEVKTEIIDLYTNGAAAGTLVRISLKL